MAERALTADIRTPETGDVISNPRGDTYRVERPDTYGRAYVIWHGKGRYDFFYMEPPSAWHYVSRADNGPVTTDGASPEDLGMGDLMPCGHYSVEQSRDDAGAFCGGCEPSRLPPVSEAAVAEAMRRIRAIRERRKHEQTTNGK